MKIIRNKKTTITEQQEIAVGKKGDYILVEGKATKVHGKGRKTYRFGKLETVVKKGETQYIKFNGNWYTLDFFELMGMEFPYFCPPKNSNENPFRNCSYHSERMIDSVIVGLSNIIAYLENHPDQRYIGHADLIRRIADAQIK